MRFDLEGEAVDRDNPDFLIRSQLGGSAGAPEPPRARTRPAPPCQSTTFARLPNISSCPVITGPLGARSIGHPDPGAITTSLIFEAMTNYARKAEV